MLSLSAWSCPKTSRQPDAWCPYTHKETLIMYLCTKYEGLGAGPPVLLALTTTMHSCTSQNRCPLPEPGAGVLVGEQQRTCLSALDTSGCCCLERSLGWRESLGLSRVASPS